MHACSYLKILAEGKGLGNKWFFVPAHWCSLIPEGNEELYNEKVQGITAALLNKPKGAYVMMPFNNHSHWCLSIIIPWEDKIVWLNPLQGNRKTVPAEFRKLMER